MASAVLCGCETTTIIGGGTAPTAGPTAQPTALTQADKVDLVFEIDNSSSMFDKQAFLADVLTDIVDRMVNPRCVDADGVPLASQPLVPGDACPTGTHREFAPVRDMHVGVISSSLGNHGAGPLDACGDQLTRSSCNPAPNTTMNDHGRLLDRADPYATATVPTYDGLHYLAWDPEQRLDPPGESDPVALTDAFRQIVLGAGDIGCGFEAQLESWYRFLVDPEPYASIAADAAGNAIPTGVDTELLTERAKFLRPDSLLVIAVLSDENDCSTKEYGPYWTMARLHSADGTSTFNLPKARAVCSVNPNDPCCASCSQSALPEGCPADPTCADDPDPGLRDGYNLRCFDQKRRFGIDFLYPTDRYVGALTRVTIPNRSGELVPNPIFSNLNPNDAATGVRGPSLVLYAPIVGVPWQDIANDPNDLSSGYKTAEQLAATGTWDVILGDPAHYVAPTDPLMIESIDPRTGTNPITGDALAPPSSPPDANPINGHERAIDDQNDLQYVCVLPLASGTERSCSVAAAECAASCDCIFGLADNPICQADPTNGGAYTLQTKAKAYPGIRELDVAKNVGTQAVVASICPAQASVTTMPDSALYAYRPFVGSLISQMKSRLPAGE